MRGRLKDRIQKGSIILSVWDNEAIVDGRKVWIRNFRLSRMCSKNNDEKPMFYYDFREADLARIKEAIDDYLKKWIVNKNG